MTPKKEWFDLTQRFVFGGVLLLALVAGAWRCVDIDRDPDVVTQSSQEAWGDPAFYLYNARAHALSGDWRASEGLSMFITPGYAFLASLCMSVFGVVFHNLVVMAMIAGFVFIVGTSLLAESAALSDGLPRWHAAAAASVLMLGSYIVFASQHVPNGDMEAIAAASIAAFFLSRLQVLDPVKNRAAFRFAGIAGGFGIGFAPFMKLHVAIFSIAAVLAWIVSYFILDSAEWRPKWRAATPYIAIGLVAAVGMWLAWAIWLVRSGFGGELVRQFDRLRIFSVLTATPEQSQYNPKGTFAFARFFYSNLFYRQPLETILGALGFFGFIAGRRKNWPLLLSCVWLVVGFAVLAGLNPDPLRYRLIVWPAAVALAAHFWTGLASGKRLPGDLMTRWIVVVGLGVVLGWVAMYFAFLRFRVTVPVLLQIGIFAAAIAFAYGVWSLLLCTRPAVSAVVLAVLLVSVSLPQWISGERSVSHELQAAAHRLDKYPDAVLGGGWGVRLGFSSRRNAYLSWTPEARQRVTLFVEDPLYLSEIPLPWHELERHVMRRLPLSIAFVQIDR